MDDTMIRSMTAVIPDRSVLSPILAKNMGPKSIYSASPSLQDGSYHSYSMVAEGLGVKS